MKKIVVAFLPLFLLLALVIFLRGERKSSDINMIDHDYDTLVIVTPHSDQIKYEFSEAFQEYYFNKYNRKVYVDFRSLGGTSDIARYIANQYETSFRHYYVDVLGKKWGDKEIGSFSNPYITKENPELWSIRQEFLNSNVSIGIDIFWGGGTYDLGRNAKQGFAVDGKVKERHPELFHEDIIPENYSGETLYEADGKYYGVCLSSFGICYNVDRIAEIGDNFVIRNWDDLGNPKLYNQLILADPSKSGSVNKCFELIIQHKMAEAVKNYGEADGLNIGWSNGINLIKQMVANSTYVADSAGKITNEVARGNGAAGIAIDFYAFTENEYSAAISVDNKASIYYQVPDTGAPISADPIQLLRGSPNEKVAQEFIDFLLSKDGQKIWQYRLNTIDGPKKYALRRPPIRKDLFTEEYTKFFSDPDYNPYDSAANVEYKAAWTGRYFNLIRVLIRCTLLDVDKELRQAWKAIIDAGGAEKVPEAMGYFTRDIVPYSECAAAAKKLYVNEENSMLDIVKQRKLWSQKAAENFQKAYELAKEGR